MHRSTYGKFLRLILAENWNGLCAWVKEMPVSWSSKEWSWTGNSALFLIAQEMAREAILPVAVALAEGHGRGRRLSFLQDSSVKFFQNRSFLGSDQSADYLQWYSVFYMVKYCSLTVPIFLDNKAFWLLFSGLNLPVTMYLSKVTSSRDLCWAEQIGSDALGVHLAHWAGVFYLFRLRVVGCFFLLVGFFGGVGGVLLAS